MTDVNRAKLVFFTDLDGTLLDHDTYDWSPARPALVKLAASSIPLVINSSKTAAEIRVLREELDNHDPYIVENGAAVVIPADYFGPGQEQLVRFGASRTEVLAVLADLRRQGFRFQGFADMTDHQLQEATSLPLHAARLARQRVATEPLLLQGDAALAARFQQALENVGLRLVRGGRFFHAMGAFDKADGVRFLLDKFRESAHPDPLLSVALGDSPNDEQMLAAVDVPVIIRGPQSSRVSMPAGRQVTSSPEAGPTGWNECVLRILAEQGL